DRRELRVLEPRRWPVGPRPRPQSEDELRAARDATNSDAAADERNGDHPHTGAARAPSTWSRWRRPCRAQLGPADPRRRGRAALNRRRLDDVSGRQPRFRSDTALAHLAADAWRAACDQ